MSNDKLTDSDLERHWRDDVIARLNDLIDGPDVQQRAEHRKQWNSAFDERLRSIDGCAQVITICAVIATLAVLYFVFFK